MAHICAVQSMSRVLESSQAAGEGAVDGALEGIDLTGQGGIGCVLVRVRHPKARERMVKLTLRAQRVEEEIRVLLDTDELWENDTSVAGGLDLSRLSRV